MTLRTGPDGARYLIAAQGHPVARPFHLRWLLPAVCGTNPRRWWACWWASWPVLAAGMFSLSAHLGWRRALFAMAIVVTLPGVIGPKVTRPVGVDLPAMALGVAAAGAAVHGWWWAALALVLWAGMVKESAPLFAALWAWHPLLLVGLAAPALVAVVRRAGMDELTARPDLREIHDHPVRTAWSYRRDRNWLVDPALWLHPFGVTLAGLVNMSTQTAVTVAVAAAQCVVATDTTRLLASGAGPALAVGAATWLPVEVLPLLVAVHVFWPWPRVVA